MRGREPMRRVKKIRNGEREKVRGSISCCTDMVLEVFLFSSRTLTSNSIATENSSYQWLISHFHLLQQIKTEKLEDRSCTTTKIWLLQINRTTALSLLSLPGTVLGARWDQWRRYMDYPARLGCRVWSMKDTHCLKPDKGILQQRADLKDSSRLKLIETLFVGSGVFYISSLSHSLFYNPQKWGEPKSE